MHVLLDHLAAVIVSSVLVLMFATLQMRGLQSSSETTVNHVVRSSALDIAQILERDLENMRTDAQVQEAINRGVLTGGVGFACNAVASGDTTFQFTFPTLTDPQNVASLSDPMDAPVAIVRYELNPTGETETRWLDGVEVTHSLFNIQRFVGTTLTGGSQGGVTDFRISFAPSGSPTFTPASGACPSNLDKVRFQLQMTLPGLDMQVDQQQSVSQLHFSRHGSTVDLINWE